MKTLEMKNYFRIISIAILLGAISFSSCDKDDVKLFATMTAKIDGTDWTSVVRVPTLQSDNFVITGTSLEGEVIVITIHGSDEGAYTLP